MRSTDEYLLRCLVDEGFAEQGAVDRAPLVARERAVPVDDALVAEGVCSARDVAIARAILCECPYVDIATFDVDIANARLLPRSAAEAHEAFPLFRLDGLVVVGMLDPLDLRAIDQLRRLLRVEIEPVLCEPEALRSLIGRAYSLAPEERRSARGTAPDDELVSGEEPIVAAVNQMLSGAIDEQASDVHISPCEHDLELRYRIDGVLQARQGPPLSAHPSIVQRLKVMASLDLTQTRRPQDGKFRFRHRGATYELRLSTLPTVDGENVVMRILRPHGEVLDFPALGMPEAIAAELDASLARPHGMLLVTGPTGSGKTSTLYAALRRLHAPERNVMTIEDPVEIRMRGIRQVQTNRDIGLTFAAALRSMLRQDPDVVLVGEIRDDETAMISTQAALTGHLVLSTLHTNDAAGAAARLRDLGVPPFVIASALLGVVAQRLVRLVCEACAEADDPPEAMRRRFGVAPDAPLRRGRGCARCGGSGHRGRTGIFELLRMRGETALRVERSASTREIAEAAFQDPRLGPMWRDGLAKSLAGRTTLAEIARAVLTTGERRAPGPVLERDAA